MPLFGTRVFRLTIPGSPTGGPFGENQLVFHDEMVSSEIGQVGTQFDGLGHIGRLQGGNTNNKNQMLYYNGFTEGEIATSEGLVKLGIEKIKPIITRGILIDIAKLQGDLMLMVPYPLRDCRQTIFVRVTPYYSEQTGADIGLLIMTLTTTVHQELAWR